MIYNATWWSIETGGWRIDDSEDSTAFLPCDTTQESALVVSAFRKAFGVIGPEELWEMSGEASPAQAARVAVVCGDFQGYHAAYDADDLHWRVWWLAHDRVHVYATYNCAAHDEGRHDAALDWLMSTMKALPYVA